MAGLVTLLDLALGALALYLLKTLLSPPPRGPPLPPGPRPLPLIGNLLDLPKEYDWLHWAKHKALYGPISSVSVFGQHLIILSDPQLAFELLEKKSATYSDRPRLEFGGEMCGWRNTLALQRYGERFRAYRKNIYQLFGTRAAVARFHPLAERETRRFLARVLAQPAQLTQHIRTTAGAIILKISHGYTIEPHARDPLVDLADEALVQFSLSTQPGAWLVDVVPLLRRLPDWAPGAGFKKTARRWHHTLAELAEKPHAFVKHQMAHGAAAPSYTSALLEHELSAEDEFVVKWSAASLYSGGADTTVSAISGFFLAMVLYPDVQRAAQAELDAVVGDRLPAFADRARLPYVEAVVKEVLRWNSVAPMGLPHVATAEDVVAGFRIPRGAIVLANIWQFNHDPAHFRDPMAFRPERFLGPAPEQDPHALSFGFGRRICPGKELADATVFMTVALSLAALRIGKARDAAGAEITPTAAWQTGVISHPKEYRCSITARSARAAALVAAAAEEHPAPRSDAAELRDVAWVAEPFE